MLLKLARVEISAWKSDGKILHALNTYQTTFRPVSDSVHSANRVSPTFSLGLFFARLNLSLKSTFNNLSNFICPPTLPHSETGISHHDQLLYIARGGRLVWRDINTVHKKFAQHSLCDPTHQPLYLAPSTQSLATHTL